jgi:anti-sigma factor RsiW
MSCQELVEVLTDYFDGRLSAHDLARYEAHVASCKDCQLYVEQFRTTLALIRNAG